MGTAFVQAVAHTPAWLFALAALLAIALIVAVTLAVVRAQLRPAVIDPSTPGASGEAVTIIDGRDGKVLVNGEYWSARTREGIHAIAPGEAVRVVAIHGLRLTVEPLEGAHET